MVTVIVGPVMAVVAVGDVPPPLPYPFVGGFDEPVEVLVVAVGAAVVEPVEVLLPQAANRISAPKVRRQNQPW